MEEGLNRVVSQEAGAAEERMLRADLVREIVACKEHGEGCQADCVRTPSVAIDESEVLISLRRGLIVAGEISAFIAITDRDWFECLSATRTAHRPNVAFRFKSSAGFCE